MNANAASSVRMNNTCSEKCPQGGNSPGFSSEFFAVCDCDGGIILRLSNLWELLYADDLVIMHESLDGLLNHFTAWKDSFDAKELRVNMSRTKILVRNALAQRTVNPSKYPCNVCKKGVGNNSIFVHHGKR